MSYVDVVKEVVSNVEEVLNLGESLAVVLLNYEGDMIVYYDEVVAVLEPPRLELKALPSYLWYLFLGSGMTLLVICVANMLDQQWAALVSVCKSLSKQLGG